MKQRIRALLIRAAQRLAPPPIKDRQPSAESILNAIGAATKHDDDWILRENLMRSCELAEARQMAGAGPWLPADVREAVGTPALAQRLKESQPISAMGAYGDIELALQNVEWRREINSSWLEFSRWGIQQIILICRLFYIKNPIVRRLVDVCADYVFARGVEVSSTDDAANDILQAFFEANQKVLGQGALADLEKRKDYDGNLFFAFFSDTKDKGTVTIRTIDALEIMDVINDPDDSSTPWFYHRIWTQKTFDELTGTTAVATQEAWYPALGYDRADRPPVIGRQPVMWDTPVYHRKCGHIATWIYGCPRVYPMNDWARTAKDWLTATATVNQQLAQFALMITTKGGQQAIEGIKQQIQTQVGPGGGQSLWDSNPPAGTGSIFASGPGTTLEAFKTQGAGSDPEKVRQYKLQCCMVAGVPETFLGDVSTGNLATATSLDRPTETGFLAKQEAWVEDLTIIGRYVLSVSSGAPNGKLREAMQRAGVDRVRIIAMERRKDHAGRFEYFPLNEAGLAKAKDKRATIEVKVTFPAIREGDIPMQVTAVTQAMTLGTQSVIGIDEREGIRKLGELLDLPDWDEIVNKMFPAAYEIDRTKEPPEPVAAVVPPGKKPTVEAMREAAARLLRGLKILESSGEDAHEHAHNGRN